jgi:galactose oxidase
MADLVLDGRPPVRPRAGAPVVPALPVALALLVLVLLGSGLALGLTPIGAPTGAGPVVPRAPDLPGTPVTARSPGGHGAHAAVLPAAAMVPLPTALDTGPDDRARYYAVRNVGTHLCLDIAGSSTAPGAFVVQQSCVSTARSQRLYLRQLSATTYQLATKHSDLCLRVAGASTADGALVEQRACARSGTGLTGSRFTVRRVGSAVPPTYQLVTDPAAKCVRSPGTTVGWRVLQVTCGTTPSFLWTLEPEAVPVASDTTGRWSPVYPVPSTPVSAALLPNGKVLTFASWRADRFGGSSGTLDQTHTVLLDPASPTTPVGRLVTSTTHNMFCPGTALLPDGRLLVNGGDDWVTQATSIYSWTTDSWARGPAMIQPRWYNSSVTLPSGEVFTFAGNRHMPEYDGSGEVWSGPLNRWRAVPGASVAPTLTPEPLARPEEHPRLFVGPNGKVFFAGPSPALQWYDVAGTGSVTSAGRRGDDETSQNAVTVMYDVGRILKAGGDPAYGQTDTERFVPANRLTYTMDIRSGGTAVVTKVAPMTYPRAFANGVVLPTGQVLVVGGADHGSAFTDDGGVMVPELFDPRTGRWTELAPMARARPYHSVALLLPDGRVLVGGGGLCWGNVVSCPSNHPDVEIFSPPYLFSGTRPAITSAPTTVPAAGGTFGVGVSGTVTGFSLVRLSSVTHSVNTDQRFLRLASTGTGATRTVTAPADRNVAPPGYYMLFALDGDVPSTSRMIRLS